MSQHEAARTPDQSGDAATTNGGATPPAAPSPRRDERPRPQYGEYAPEGWTWTPPVDERAAAAEAANAEAAAAVAPAAPAAPSHAAAGAHPIDRMWTITLLVFGVFGALYNSLALFQLPTTALESAKLSASVLGVEPPADFVAGPAVPAFIFVGIALQLALWVVALLWSRARMRAGRLAWWVPFVAGVAAFIVVVVVGMLVFASDPAFMPSLTPAQP
ncbi:DUF6264 family protein [Agromyces cerinus]|uniref:Uncharacterized protein n=1 Tax=Agromyces cerinus subsp. cerinus TaxID=232089 RepID=A0A1N6HQQ9_9MICO|nr:DUF6264 family protein [Agromyces cerinus]SIO22046.1 hypothetical protein SAMN05443544_3405 [Agromyces cerinus subsp. cerinus]